MATIITNQVIKELKAYILNRNIDKISETLTDEEVIEAYAQAIKARDSLYNTNKKEELAALIESYCSCESNVEPGKMVAKAAFTSLWTGGLFLTTYALLSLSMPEIAHVTSFYKGLQQQQLGLS